MLMSQLKLHYQRKTIAYEWVMILTDAINVKTNETISKDMKRNCSVEAI